MQKSIHPNMIESLKTNSFESSVSNILASNVMRQANISNHLKMNRIIQLFSQTDSFAKIITA